MNIGHDLMRRFGPRTTRVVKPPPPSVGQRIVAIAVTVAGAAGLLAGMTPKPRNAAWLRESSRTGATTCDCRRWAERDSTPATRAPQSPRGASRARTGAAGTPYAHEAKEHARRRRPCS